jgi:hypothetical protein
LQLGGALLFDAGYEREQLPMGGEARAARGELRGFLAWTTRRYPWIAYLGPSLAMSLQRGETRNVAPHSSRLRALWAGGGEGGVAWSLSRQLALELSGSVALTAPALSGRFYVNSREVLPARVLSAQVGLAAGYAF